MTEINRSLNDRPRLKIVGTQDKTEIGGFSVVGDGLNPCVAYFAYSDDAQFFCDIWNMGEPRGRLSASVQTENVGSNPTSPANTSEISDNDLIEALMNEHDMDVPDNLLASPDHPHFKAHRNGVKAMIRFLNKHGYKKPPEPVSVSLEKCTKIVEETASIDASDYPRFGPELENAEEIAQAVLDAAGVKYAD